MAFDDKFFDGFDAYGPTGFSPIVNGVENDQSVLLAEWTGLVAYGTAATGQGVQCTVIDSLFGQGQAMRVAYTLAVSGVSGGLSKTLAQNFERLVFGVQARVDLTALTQAIVFGDAGNDQLAITIEPSGQIGLRIGGGFTTETAARGTLVALSDESVSTGLSFILEGAITFAPSGGRVKIWLNNNETSLDYTGDTTATANSSANQVRVICTSSNAVPGGSHVDIDNLYVFGQVTAGADTPLLDNTIVVTDFPIADSSIDFDFGSALLGEDASRTTSTNAPGAAKLFLRQWTPDTDCQLDTVGLMPAATSVTAKFKGVAYADSGGVPAALLSAGVEVIGCAEGVRLHSNLNTPQALVAGTPIWLGFIGDTSVAIALSDVDANVGVSATNTYGSGAPNPAPAMTLNRPDWLLYGIASGVADNFWSVVDTNPQSPRAYMTSDRVGDQDLYEFPMLDNTPTTIYSVAMKAVALRSGPGSRTFDLRVKSGATTGSGDAPAQALAASASIVSSYFDTDPDTGAAWNASGVNLMTGGYKINS